MSHIVECLVAFDQAHDLGEVANVALGDYCGFSGRPAREVRSARVTVRRYHRGEQIVFATAPAATAFVNHHSHKFRYIGRQA